MLKEKCHLKSSDGSNSELSASQLISCEVPTWVTTQSWKQQGTTQAINGSAWFSILGYPAITSILQVILVAPAGENLDHVFFFISVIWKCASFAGVISLTTASAIQSWKDRVGCGRLRFPSRKMSLNQNPVPPRTWQTLALTTGGAVNFRWPAATDDDTWLKTLRVAVRGIFHQKQSLSCSISRHPKRKGQYTRSQGIRCLGDCNDIRTNHPSHPLATHFVDAAFFSGLHTPLKANIAPESGGWKWCSLYCKTSQCYAPEK